MRMAMPNLVEHVLRTQTPGTRLWETLTFYGRRTEKPDAHKVLYRATYILKADLILVLWAQAWPWRACDGLLCPDDKGTDSEREIIGMPAIYCQAWKGPGSVYDSSNTYNTMAINI